MTYTAVYRDTTFTVTFDADNGTEVMQVSVKSGDPVVRPEDPVKAGYTFAGWFNGKNEYDFTKAVEKDLTLVAHWKQESAPAPEEPQMSTKEAEAAILQAAGDQDMSGATFYKLQARQKISTKKAISIMWKRVPGAASYTIYAAKCGQKMKKVAKVRGSKTSYTKKKLQPGKYYKFIVVANGNGKGSCSEQDAAHRDSRRNGRKCREAEDIIQQSDPEDREEHGGQGENFEERGCKEAQEYPA